MEAQTLTKSPPESAGYDTCVVHSDFIASDRYVFTALLYLSDYGLDFTGGETTFVDEYNYNSDWYAAVRRGDLSAVTG